MSLPSKIVQPFTLEALNKGCATADDVIEAYDYLAIVLGLTPVPITLVSEEPADCYDIDPIRYRYYAKKVTIKGIVGEVSRIREIDKGIALVINATGKDCQASMALLAKNLGVHIVVAPYRS